MTHPRFAGDERDAVTTHVRECDLCRADPPAVAETIAVLRASRTVDVSAESSWPLLRVALRRQARRSLSRRVAFALAVGIIPLPVVLAYDALILRLAFDVIRQLLPTEIAAYAVFSYGALCLFLISLTYAAVPVLLTKAGRPRTPSPIGATS